MLEDFYAIGDDRRPLSAQDNFAVGIAEQIKELQARKAKLLESAAKADQQPGNSQDGKGDDFRGREGDESYAVHAEASNTLSTPPDSSPISASQKKRKREIALGEIDPNFESGSSQSLKRAKVDLSISRSRSSFKTAPSRPSSSSGAHVRQPNPTIALPAKSAHPAASNKSVTGPKHRQSAGHVAARRAKEDQTRPLPIERSLDVRPLSTLRGCRRNDVFDVFAIVHSVSDPEFTRLRMPKRSIRLVDPSTDKKVLLSVFVDPDNFVPAVGTIALIRSVTTHEWEGGSLNIYPNPCEGREWFQPDPVGVTGCDVEAMRQWWEAKAG